MHNHKKEVTGFSPEAMDLLNSRNYPGNVRELAQIIENAVLITDSNLILPCHLGMMSTNPSPFSAPIMHIERKR